jgi:hypothetical protein
VFINSPGGQIFDGFAIYNMLARHPASKTIRIDGLAASISSVIAMAGDKIIMAENSFLLIHRSSGVVIGNSQDMRDFSETMEKFDDSIARAYEKKTGKTHEEILQIMSEETWLAAKEAIDAGFVDELAPAMQVAAFFDLSKFSKAPANLSRPADATPAPAPTPLPVALDTEQIRTAVRDEEASRAAQIFDICGAAGVPHLAPIFFGKGQTGDQVRAQLADPDFIKAQKSIAISGEVKEIIAICNGAGVLDVAQDLIARGMSVDDVRDWLRDAQPIRDCCAAAFGRDPKAAKERADKYIRAGLHVSEVRNELLHVMQALAGPEIDNRLGPEAGFPTQKTTFDRTVIEARYSKNRFDAAEIYENWRNPKRRNLQNLVEPLIEALKKLSSARG